MMDYCETYVLEQPHILLLLSSEDDSHFAPHVKVATDPSPCLSVDISNAINNTY
jgi:hypothetical protein